MQIRLLQLTVLFVACRIHPMNIQILHIYVWKNKLNAEDGILTIWILSDSQEYMPIYIWWTIKRNGTFPTVDSSPLLLPYVIMWPQTDRLGSKPLTYLQALKGRPPPKPNPYIELKLRYICLLIAFGTMHLNGTTETIQCTAYAWETSQTSSSSKAIFDANIFDYCVRMNAWIFPTIIYNVRDNI